jgi:hypothetical protein
LDNYYYTLVGGGLVPSTVKTLVYGRNLKIYVCGYTLSDGSLRGTVTTIIDPATMLCDQSSLSEARSHLVDSEVTRLSAELGLNPQKERDLIVSRVPTTIWEWLSSVLNPKSLVISEQVLR